MKQQDQWVRFRVLVGPKSSCRLLVDKCNINMEWTDPYFVYISQRDRLHLNRLGRKLRHELVEKEVYGAAHDC